MSFPCRLSVFLLALLPGLSAPAAPAQAEAPSGPSRPAPTEQMVLVPGGPFLMGTPADRQRAPAEEKPQHTVTLPAYRIDRFEVTNAEYARFLEATGKSHPATCHSAEAAGKDHTPHSSWWGDPEWNAPEKPVVGVDWFDAYAYCAWSGRRLPTEAEWEKAARGTDGRRHAWGNLAPGAGRFGNFADEAARRANPDWNVVPGYDDGFVHTAPVGSFPEGASPYGALDMMGNVWEWVNDWFSETAYSEGTRADPAGPPEGTKRVLRGGSWDSTPNFLRSAVRYGSFPGYRGNAFGFRCARDVAPGSRETAPAMP